MYTIRYYPIWQLLTTVWLLSMIAVMVPTGASASATTLLHTTTRYDPLADWLWNLTVWIPNQHFKETIFSLDIQDMQCTHFAIEGIDSIYVPSSSSNSNTANSTLDPSIGLAVAGISASCDGTYKTTGLSGHVFATVASSQPLEMNLAFISNSTKTSNIRMATSVSTEHCQANLGVSKLDFKGSISAKVINLFRSEIRGYVSDALSTQLCPALKDTVDQQLTKVLQQADDYLAKLIPKDDEDDDNNEEVALVQKRKLPLQESSSSVWKWSREAPLVPKVLQIVNAVLAQFLNEGVFLNVMKLLLFDLDTFEGDDCGYFFRGWNGLLHQLTRGTLDFAIPDQLRALKNITFIVPHYASISILPKRIQIAGIDQFDKLQLLQFTKNESFWTKVVVPQGLNLSASLDIIVSTIPGGAFKGDTPLEESFHISINTTSLDVTSNLTLDFNRTRFRQTTLNHIISAVHGNKADLGCSLYPIDSFGIDTLLANVAVQSISLVPNDLTTSSLGGKLEKDLDEMLNSFLNLFLTEYDNLVTLSFAGLLNGPAKQLAETAANNWIQDLIHGAPNDGLCEASAPAASTTDYLNFSHFQILDRFHHFLNESVDTANSYLECVSNVLTTQVQAVTPTLEYAGATLSLQNVEIENAGSLKSIELMLPDADGYHLSNSLEVGTCTGSKDTTTGQNATCTGPQLTVETEISVPSMNLSGTVNLTAAVGSFKDSISAFLLYDMNLLKNLTVSEILSCNMCFAKPAAEAVLYAAPQILDHLSIRIDADIDTIREQPINLQLDSATYMEATSTLKSAMSWFQMNVVEGVNRIVSHMVNTAEASCGKDYENGGDDDHEDWKTIISALVFLLPFYILSHILYVAFIQTGSRESSHRYEPLVASENTNSSDSKFDTLREKDASLMTKENIPSGARHLFPVILIATIALLVVSNLSLGASVDLSVSTKDVQGVIRLPSLFGFSLGNTMREMYHAGIYVLLSIVVVFSGIWPYLKLVMMLWAWIAPESMFSVKKRGKLLFSLDALSKFSLVDTFVLVIMMVSFRFHLPLGDSAIIDVFVNPRFGFYGFLIATTVSLLAGHVELHVHRRCVSTENESEDESSVSLFTHQYSCDGRKYALSKVFKALLLAFMAVVVILLFIGSFMKSFTFEFGGVAGALLGDNNKKSYSLISIGRSIPESVEDSTGPGIMFLQVVYFFYASIMPFLCLLSLSILMVVPMKQTQQEFWLTAAEVANAWSAIEVFVLSIIAALFEISTFASFIVGNKCDIINQVLEDQFDDQLNGDDKCYSVDASVSANVWFLVVGVVLNSTLVSSLLRMAQVVVEERASGDDNDDLNNVVQRITGSAFSMCMLELVQEDPLAAPLLDESQELVRLELDGGTL